MLDNITIAVHVIARLILTSLSVDEKLLPRYVNLFTNFRGLSLTVKMAPSGLKHMYCVLFFLFCFVLFCFILRSSQGQCFLLSAPGYTAVIRLGRCICKKHYIICIVCVYKILSASTTNDSHIYLLVVLMAYQPSWVI